MPDANQLVNVIGKYVFKHMPGATEFVKRVNLYEVYITLKCSENYNSQLECEDSSTCSESNIVNEAKDVKFLFVVKSYSNKVNTTIFTNDYLKSVIGYKDYEVADFSNMNVGCEKVLKYTKKRISVKFPNCLWEEK